MSPARDAVAVAPAPAAALQLAGVPPQLDADAAGEGRLAWRPAGATRDALQGLAGYAGLCQRVFVGLLMAWTLLVALGLFAA